MKKQYVANIIIATQNNRITYIAEAMYDAQIPLLLGKEFLAYYDNFAKRSGMWNDDNTSYIFDDAFEFNTAGVLEMFMGYISLKRDANEKTINTLKSTLIGAYEMINGLQDEYAIK